MDLTGQLRPKKLKMFQVLRRNPALGIEQSPSVVALAVGSSTNCGLYHSYTSLIPATWWSNASYLWLQLYFFYMCLSSQARLRSRSIYLTCQQIWWGATKKNGSLINMFSPGIWHPFCHQASLASSLHGGAFIMASTVGDQFLTTKLCNQIWMVLTSQNVQSWHIVIWNTSLKFASKGWYVVCRYMYRSLSRI